MKITKILITVACVLFLPAITMADPITCPEVVKKLYQITSNESLRTSFFNTATVALFEESLGQGEKQLTPDSMIEYQWTCSEDNTSSIAIYTKDGTNIVSFSGVIKTEEDPVKFAASAQTQPPKQVTKAVTEQPTDAPAQLY